MRTRLWIGAGAMLSGLAAAGTAEAFDFNLGDAAFTLDNHLSEGAAWRLEQPDSGLIGKLDLQGQQNLCATDGCLYFGTGANPAPNERLVRAAGAFAENNGDQGDLNFRQFDIVAGATKLDSSLGGKWRGFSLKVSGTALFDPVNANLQDRNVNTTYQPPLSDAPAQSRRMSGRTVFLRDAVLGYGTNFWDRNFSLAVGQQTVHWGEASYIAVNSLNELNPPDERLYHMPGVRFSEIFQPTPLAKFDADLMEGLSLQTVYQLKWKSAIVDQSGTFYSDRNVTDQGSPVDLTLSQVPVDPTHSHPVPGLASLISSSSPTVRMGPQRNGDDWGQYGAHLTYFSQDIGTEFGLYYLRYTGRLPNFSAYAASNSCIRNLPNTPGSAGWITNLLTAASDCNGFNGSLTPFLNPIFHANGNGKPMEPLPLGTIVPFFEYPSGIHMFGTSFNTNIFGWALSGEYSYRPNVPLQVDVNDVLFTAVQPAFPKQTISLGPLGYLPGSEIYYPSYLMAYRGELDNNGYSTIQPNQYIPGWIRRKVSQLDVTALKAISNGNWFKADQIILVTEIGAQEIHDPPGRNQLQLDAGDPNDTHASAGADGTGFDICRQNGQITTATTSNCDGTPYTLRFNPTTQTSGFASRWSWGIREQARFEYDNLFKGITYKPSVLVAADFSGYGALPVQDFVKGRWQLVDENVFNLTQAWSFNLIYSMNTGGQPVNTQYDRDTIAAVVTYDF